MALHHCFLDVWPEHFIMVRRIYNFVENFQELKI
jgi:hypothetical protein